MSSRNKESMTDRAKSHMKTGIVSMAGMGAMGAIAGTPGFPAAGAGIMPIAGAGFSLANVGETAKTGMTIANMMQGSKIRSKGKGKGLAIGKGKGPIGRMKF